ncbi:MAG: hypothetical protein ACRDRI_23780 [Pseudonocardiaceae bacterium]
MPIIAQQRHAPVVHPSQALGDRLVAPGPVADREVVWIAAAAAVGVPLYHTGTRHFAH